MKIAHDLKMSVTVHTFRSGATGKFANVTEEVRYYLTDLKVDAVFTDDSDKYPRK